MNDDDEFDFTQARPATAIDHLNRLRATKTRITLLLDEDVLAGMHLRAEAMGLDYQALINQTLRQALAPLPFDADTLRRIVREELDRTTKA